MNQSYELWRQHGGHQSKLDSVTWTSNDLNNLHWEKTHSIDEIPVNDSWDTFATKNKLAQEAMYKAWGVPKEGGRHYMSIRPVLNRKLQCIIEPYVDKKYNYNFLKLTPGCQLMWHYDTYATFVKFNDIEQTQIQNVCRSAIMMLDWDRGQIFQIGDKIYSHWKAGDTFTWKGDTWHGLCNFGPSDVVIGQITFLDDEDRYSQQGE